MLIKDFLKNFEWRTNLAIIFSSLDMQVTQKYESVNKLNAMSEKYKTKNKRIHIVLILLYKTIKKRV